MFCIKCGVQLSDTEKKCPLCNTVVYHPDIDMPLVAPLYPKNAIPKVNTRSKAFNGALLILLFIPLLVSFLADFNTDATLNWFGFVAGALILVYISLCLPLWFKKPNPVIFTPCSFAATALYLYYINFITGGNWFFKFALPVTCALCVIICTVVTLIYYLKKGKLYILGGAFMALGALMLLIEFLILKTFNIAFAGWSFYPLVVLVLLGGLLIFLAINRSARQMMERKLFF